MNLVIGLILLFILLQAIKQFGRMDAATAARLVRHGGGVLGMIGALLLLLRGRFGLAATVAGHDGELRRLADDERRLDVLSQCGRGRASGSVLDRPVGDGRNAAQDHDNGVMTGTILAGAYAGRAVESLSRPELVSLRQELMRDDPDGARLLEAYLDRRFAGWRETDQGQASKAGRRAGRCRAGRRLKSWVSPKARARRT